MFRELEIYANFDREKRNAFEWTVKQLMKAANFEQGEAAGIVMSIIIETMDKSTKKKPQDKQ